MDYSKLDDETLLTLTAHAQQGALSELYDRYSRLVYSVAWNSLSDQALAEEITQDVFLRVWEKAETYRSEQGRVATWLASIARNRAIDTYRRSRSRQANLHVPWDVVEGLDLPAPLNVEAEGDLAQRAQQVRWAIAQLPAEQKQALGMAYFWGLSHQEISQTLGEPLGTIKTRLRLGMQKLRELLQVENVV